jgi:nucleoside-triphosphatase
MVGGRQVKVATTYGPVPGDSSTKEAPPVRLHLITSLPGMGKTTAIKSLAAALPTGSFGGFYTEEIRVSGGRTGFRAVTFGGKETILAHVSFKSGPRVGKYGVDLPAFESIVVPEIDPHLVGHGLLLIDEIGKMECASEYFTRCVREILAQGRDMVATVAAKGGGLIGEVKRRPEAFLHKLHRSNRERLPHEILGMLRSGE